MTEYIDFNSLDIVNGKLKKSDKKYGVFAFNHNKTKLYGFYHNGIIHYFNDRVSILSYREAKELSEKLQKRFKASEIDKNSIFICKISGNHLSTVLKKTGKFYKVNWKDREKILGLYSKYSASEIKKRGINIPPKRIVVANVAFYQTRNPKDINIFGYTGF